MLTLRVGQLWHRERESSRENLSGLRVTKTRRCATFRRLPTSSPSFTSKRQPCTSRYIEDEGSPRDKSGRTRRAGQELSRFNCEGRGQEVSPPRPNRPLQPTAAGAILSRSRLSAST